MVCWVARSVFQPSIGDGWRIVHADEQIESTEQNQVLTQLLSMTRTIESPSYFGAYNNVRSACFFSCSRHFLLWTRTVSAISTVFSELNVTLGGFRFSLATNVLDWFSFVGKYCISLISNLARPNSIRSATQLWKRPQTNSQFRSENRPENESPTYKNRQERKGPSFS